MKALIDRKDLAHLDAFPRDEKAKVMSSGTSESSAAAGDCRAQAG